MLNLRRIWTNPPNLHKRLYRSPENGLELKVIRYTTSNLLKKILFRNPISNVIKEDYLTKEKKRIKWNELKCAESIYNKVLSLYFDWVIIEAIKGNIIKLFGTNDYIVKVQCYTPTEVEVNRMKFFKELPIDTAKDRAVPIEDFYLNRYRIAIYKLNTEGSYDYAGYFFKLNIKYKRMFRQQVKKDAGIYVTNITI